MVHELRQGQAPLIVSVPHAGIEVPPEIAAKLSEPALGLPDTDWHVDKLYDFTAALDATMIVARYSRYVIDLNRPPDGAPLYPGSAETGLCPVETFAGEAIYARTEDRPDEAEITARRERYWAPYHRCLADEIERVADLHGRVLLWDAHSIRSVVPRLFDGELPTLNLGTNAGKSCAPEIAAALWETAQRSGLSRVLDGRFRGGYITRHYGRPDRRAHAIQLELAQAAYMKEQPPYRFDAKRAEALRPVLRRLLETFIASTE